MVSKQLFSFNIKVIINNILFKKIKPDWRIRMELTLNIIQRKTGSGSERLELVRSGTDRIIITAQSTKKSQNLLGKFYTSKHDTNKLKCKIYNIQIKKLSIFVKKNCVKISYVEQKNSRITDCLNKKHLFFYFINR